MILTHLTITNFRSHKFLDLNLQPGITGILGRNGSGKSTIIEAILWGFYGNIASRTTADQIRSTTADESESTIVDLTFELQNNVYNIIREIKGKSLTPAATISKNKNIEATSPKQVTEYMTNLLGAMNFQAFTTSIVARQSELAALSDIKPANREKIIRQMLGIDEVDQAIDTIRHDKRDISKQIDILEPTITNTDGTSMLKTQKIEQSDQETQLQTFKHNIKVATANITSLESTLQNTQNEISQMEDQYETMHKLELEKASIESKNLNYKNQIFALDNKIDTIETYNIRLPALKKEEESYQYHIILLEGLQQHKITADKITKLNNPITTCHHLNTEYNDKIDDFTSKVSPTSFHQIIEKTNTFIIAKKENIQKNTELLTILNSKLITEKNDLRIISKSLSDLKQLGPQTPCPTCTRILGDQYQPLTELYETQKEKSLKKYDEIFKSKLDLEQVLKKSNSSLETMSTQILELTKITLDSDFAQNQITELRIKINKNTKELDTLIKLQDSYQRKLPEGINISKIPDTQQKIKELNKSHEELLIANSQTEGLQDLQKEKTGLNSTLQSVIAIQKMNQTEISELFENGYSKDNLTSLKQKHESTNDQIQQLHKIINSYEYDIKTANNIIKTTSDSITTLERTTTQLTNLRSNIQILESIAGDRDTGHMILFRRTLISRIRPQLNQIASALINQMTDGKYPTIELDKNYNILMHDEGIPYDITRFSGGERDIANLCVRIAIAKLIAERQGSDGLSFIILDEIFASLDASRKNLVLHAINTLTSNFDQILLITHSDEIKDELPHQIKLE